MSTLELLEVFGFRTIYFLGFLKCFIINVNVVEFSFFNSKGFSLIISRAFIKLPCKKTAVTLEYLPSKVRNHLKVCVTGQGKEPSCDSGSLRSPSSDQHSRTPVAVGIEAHSRGGRARKIDAFSPSNHHSLEVMSQPQRSDCKYIQNKSSVRTSS